MVIRLLGAWLLLAWISACSSLAGGASVDANELTELVGTWSGQNQLWVYPGEPVREPATTAVIRRRASDDALTIAYDWVEANETQNGVLTIPLGTSVRARTVEWVDTWHTQDLPMRFRHDPQHEGLVSVRGSYSAPPGPDWGWRIVLDRESADTFRIRMWNVTPEGVEALAVNANLSRVE